MTSKNYDPVRYTNVIHVLFFFQLKLGQWLHTQSLREKSADTFSSSSSYQFHLLLQLQSCLMCTCSSEEAIKVKKKSSEKQREGQSNQVLQIKGKMRTVALKSWASPDHTHTHTRTERMGNSSQELSWTYWTKSVRLLSLWGRIPVCFSPILSFYIYCCN